MNVKTIEKISEQQIKNEQPVSEQIKQYAINNYAKDMLVALVGKYGLERGYAGVSVKAYKDCVKLATDIYHENEHTVDQARRRDNEAK